MNAERVVTYPFRLAGKMIGWDAFRRVDKAAHDRNSGFGKRKTPVGAVAQEVGIKTLAVLAGGAEILLPTSTRGGLRLKERDLDSPSNWFVVLGAGVDSLAWYLQATNTFSWSPIAVRAAFMLGSHILADIGGAIGDGLDDEADRGYTPKPRKRKYYS